MRKTDREEPSLPDQNEKNGPGGTVPNGPLTDQMMSEGGNGIRIVSFLKKETKGACPHVAHV